MKPTKSEKIWNIVSMFVFTLLFIAIAYVFHKQEINIKETSIIDFILISIATYRMTRLIVYDRLFKLFRDVIRSFEGTGIGDSVKAIVTCPWCAGVWLSLFNVAIFFLIPYGYMFIYVMSIAGIATYLQLGVNILGLTADEKQMRVREMRKKTNKEI
ncbi:MAG: DUF1360 domain-containing protein [Bacteroidota bacterium]